MNKYVLLTLTFVITALSSPYSHAGINDFLEKKDIKQKIRDEIADLDINFGGELANLDIISGVNISAKYKYEVEPSYMDKYFTRVDKWDLKTGIDIGDMIKDAFDLPFTFSINRQNSFFFARQFKTKKEALLSLPYSPKRLPLNADAALKQLAVGDFVSMPANLNIAFSAEVSSNTAAPIVLNAVGKIHFIISGEFTVQVFKVDESRVRLKMISKRGYTTNVNAGAEVSFKLFGFNLADRLVDRLIDRDLINLGYKIHPGAQFIVDYVFDLKNPHAKDAYNQILNSTFKFKDIVTLNKLGDAEELKDRLISSYEKAEKLFNEDKNLEYKDRRVTRIFKGFNNQKSKTKNLKLSLIATSFKNEKTYTENKITYTDKNEKNREFFYPTQSRYFETKLGKWFFELKDQSFQNNFGLIPRFNNEDTHDKAPDFGLQFERKDTDFTKIEQRIVQRFITGQIPTQVSSTIKLGEWGDIKPKSATRISFKVVFKSQGFDYLKDISKEELTNKLIAYSLEKQNGQIVDSSQTVWQKLKDFLFIKRFVKEERLKELASDLHTILQNKEDDSEIMLKRLVKLSEQGTFSKIGVGFLLSLLPDEKLKDLMYVKLDLISTDTKPVAFEYGILNYQSLYNELAEIQSRISYRSYDLRVTEHDQSLLTPEEELKHESIAPLE